MPCAKRSWAVVLSALGLTGCSSLGLAPSPQPVEPAPTDDMALLASRSGCLACHALAAGKPGPNALPPIGPSWPEVALRYREEAVGERRQELIDRLTRAVQDGTNPYASRWNGQISGLAMPPNAVAISPKDTRRLIDWILRSPHP